MNPDHNDAGEQEYDDPGCAGDQAQLNGEVTFDAPAPSHDVSQGLAGTGARQVPGDGLKMSRHSFDGPEDAAQQEDRIEAADGHLHCCRLGVADNGNKKT